MFRPPYSTSLLGTGEVRQRRLAQLASLRQSLCLLTDAQLMGMLGVVDDSRSGKVRLCKCKRSAVVRIPQQWYTAEVRASIRAKMRSNVRGAKGGRLVNVPR